MPEDIQQNIVQEVPVVDVPTQNVVQTIDPENPVYKFMKANKLTTLSEKDFVQKYSTPEKAKEIHSFMVANKLTTLKDSDFYGKYFTPPSSTITVTDETGLKKKVSASSDPALQNLLTFAKSGGTPSKQTQELGYTSVRPSKDEQRIINKLSRPAGFTGSDIEGIKKLQKQSSIHNPVTTDYKGMPVQELIDLQQPGALDYQVSIPGKGNVRMTATTPIPREVIGGAIQKQTEEAAINTLDDIYKKSGKEFNKDSPEGIKQIQQYVDKANKEDLVRVMGNFDQKPYLVRGKGFWESGVQGLIQSAADPIKYTRINTIFTPSDFADYADDLIAYEGNIPASAPNSLGMYGGMAGGLPKMMGLLAIPYLGEAAMVTDMYQNALANQKLILYKRGLDEGMDRQTAAKTAMETATKTAIPEAIVGMAMVKGVGGMGGGAGTEIVSNATKKSFQTALAKAAKSTSIISAMGGVAGSSEAGIEKAAGYDIKPGEILERGLTGVGEYALMDAGFKILHVATSAPKYLQASAKNYLSNVPGEILEVQAENYPDGQKILQDVQNFSKVRNEVQDLVPEEKVGSVTGLTQKINNIKEDIAVLNARKGKTTDALEPQIDIKIKEKEAELNQYNEQVKKVIESKDPAGISEEIDDVTGLRAGESLEPTQIKNPIEEVKIGKEKELIPSDLAQKGELIETTLEAERRRSNGERIFAVTEMDGTPVEVTSIEMLRNYTPDQLIAYKPIEAKAEVKPTEQKMEVKPTEVKVGAEKPSKEVVFTAHGTGDNGYVIEHAQGVEKKDVKRLEDARSVVTEQVGLNNEQKAELENTGSLITENQTLENGDKKITVHFKNRDAFSREGGSRFDLVIPENNASTAEGIKKVVDNFYAENNVLGGKRLEGSKYIQEGVRRVQKYLDSNKAELKPIEIKTEVKPTEVGKIENKRQEELDDLMPFYALARKTMMKQGDEFLRAEERSILADPVKYLQDGVENNKFNINNYEKELAESTPKELEKSYLSTGLSRKEYIKKSINRLKDSTLRIETLIKKVEDVIKKPKVDATTDLSNSKAPKDSDLEGGKKEVKPTEVKIKEEVKEKAFKSSQGNTVDIENGKLIVKDKKGEVLSDRASKKAIEEYAENFDYSKGEKAPEVPSEITNSRDAAKYVVEESSNPIEIAEIYASEDLLPKESNAKFQAIAEYGLGRIKTSSYKNLGDPNKIEKSMYLKIFSEERGTPIDVLAKSISDKYEGLNIEPQDIVDYIEKYSKGDKGALEFKESDVALQAADKFNKLTGLDLNSELANKVIDNKLGKANKDQLEIIKQDYETAKQLEDAYWAEYKKTDGFTKESNISKVNKPEPAKEPSKKLEEAYKDLTNIEKRQIINSKFEELLKELKIEKICPTD